MKTNRTPTFRLHASVPRVTLLFTLLLAAAMPSCGGGDPPSDPPDEPLDLLESEEVGLGAAGRFRVGHDGSANYSIPLRVPDGRRGVQPSIALSYNSNRPETGVGVGWAVAGGSAIARCPRTAALDGRAGRVEFDDDDALCLDGRRLVHVGGAPAAEAGARYRPQREGHELVILNRSLSDADSWFEVLLPDGGRRQYGNGPDGNALVRGERFDSDLEGSPIPIGEATRAWLINRHEDLAGNYMSYSYDHDVIWTATERAGYETYLTEIRYTGHRSLGAGERRVTFEYVPSGATYERQDRFQNGFWEYSSRLLRTVSMSAPGAESVVRRYFLEYQPSAHSRRPLLVSVQECDGNMQCLPSTQLDYTRNAAEAITYRTGDLGPTPPGWYSYLVTGGDEANDGCAQTFSQTFVLTDLDGSGEDDLLYFEQTDECEGLQVAPFGYRARLNDGDGTFGLPIPAGIPDTQVQGIQQPAELPPLIPFDIDDDGLTDIVDRRTVEGRAGIYYVQREWGFAAGQLEVVDDDVFDCVVPPYGEPDYITGVPNAVDAFLVGDIDGNGAPDLIAGCNDSCTRDGEACTEDSECCAGRSCRDGVCAFGSSCTSIGNSCMDSASCCSGLFCYRGPRPGWFDPGSCQAITDGVDWVVRAHDDASGAHDALLPRATLFNGAFASANSHLMDYAGLGRLQMLVAPAPETEATHLSAGTYEASSPAGMTFPISPTNIPHTRDGRLVYLDMNGDGLRDVLDLSGGAAAQIRLNSGRGLVEATPAYLPGVAPVDVYSGRTTGDVRVADFNQDGREDFLLLYEGDPMVPGDSVFMLHYATDAGFVRHRVDVLDAEPIYIPEFAGVPAFRSWNTVQLGDIDGDSEIDIVASNYDRLTSLTSLDERPDLLSDIRYGQPLDAAGEPRFEPLSAVRVHYARVNGGHAIRSLPAGQPSRVLYHAPSSCEFPQRCLRKGLTVVERHSELTATGDLLSDPDDEVQREQLYAHFEYTYRDGVVDTQGQGFLGFAQREVVQWDALPEAPFRRDWARTEWTFDLTTRAADGLTAFAGTPVALERHVLNLIDGRYHAQRLETELEHESPTGLNSHDGPPIIFRRPAGTRFFDYDLPEAPAELAGNPDFYLRTVTSIRYDDWSIPTRWRVSTEGGRQETMTATPARDVSTNLLARYGSIETSSLAPGFPRAAMRVDYEYDPSTQLVERMVANADDPQRIRITEFGRRASTGVVEVMNEYTWDPDSAPGAPPVLSRTGEVSYDTEQLYPTSIGVETGTTLLTSRLLVHPGLGVLQRMVGPNGATTEFRHDGFGRLREVRRVGADVIEYDHLPPTNPFDQFIVDVEASDGHHTQLTLDAFSRVRQRRELSEQPGVWWTSSSTFDARGQLARQTLPHTEGEAAPAHTMVRDDLGRVTTWRDPAGGETRVAYGSVGDGGAYDPRRMQVTTPRDNTYARYLDANGQTHRFVDPAGEEATYWYGPFGRIQHVDLPQDTFRTYEYDSNGLLDAVEDSRIGVEQYERDGFGEIFEIARPDGARVTLRRDGVGRVTRRVSDDGTAFFIYDVGPTGAGFLGTSVGEDGTSEIYSYDTEGRLSGITRGVVGASISQDYTYDPSTGRLESTRVTGPPGGLAGGAGVEFDYSNGHLTGVNSPELGRGIWRSLSLHPQGFVASEQYPETGLEVERDLDPTDRQLSWRSDVQDLEVTLDADGNVSSIVDGFDPAAGVQDFEYDDRGRLDLWSWAGTSFETDYAYDALGNVLENETGELTYDPGTTLLSGIEGMPVTHDPRGRVDSALGRAITWRDSDLFDEVQEMGTGQNVRFSYSANHARAAWQSSTGASALNLGGYRRYQDADGVRETFSVPGPTRTVAELVSVDGGALALRHVHDDHLGSTAVVSSATEEPTRFWRSPFGRLVDPADGEFLDGSTGIADLDPRFTTHRADGQTPSLGTTGAGFIHMRGREYDPALGQMLSPDPATPISSDVDGWNPYSYVVNNPSTLVDPSGYNPFDILVTGTNVIIDTGSATVTASDFLDFAQTIYNSHANPPFRDAQGDPRAAAYELFGFANGLGAWFFEFEPRRSIEDTARYEFFFTRGQAWGSAVGALGDMVMIGAGVAMMSGGEWLPFIGGGAGGEGAAVGTILGIKMWVAGAGLAAVGGAALSGYHGPRFNESIERLDRFYNERQPSGSSRPPAASAGRRAPSIRGRLRAAGTHGLPGGRQASGPFRYRPPEGYNPSDPLPRNGRNGGFIDRFGNEWQQGPYHGDPDLPFSHEWDVQLSARGRRWYERANPGHRAPDYINVRPDGYLSH